MKSRNSAERRSRNYCMLRKRFTWIESAAARREGSSHVAQILRGRGAGRLRNSASLQQQQCLGVPTPDEIGRQLPVRPRTANEVATGPRRLDRRRLGPGDGRTRPRTWSSPKAVDQIHDRHRGGDQDGQAQQPLDPWRVHEVV